MARLIEDDPGKTACCVSMASASTSACPVTTESSMYRGELGREQSLAAVCVEQVGLLRRDSWLEDGAGRLVAC